MPCGIQFVDRQAGAVLVVLAEVRLRAGQRRDMAELDDDFRLGRRCGGRSRSSRRGDRFRFFLLAAGAHGKGGGN